MTAPMSDVIAVQLLQTGGIAGLEMSATVRLTELPPEVADQARELAARVLADEPVPAVREGPSTFDAFEYELLISRAGVADDRVNTRDDALTPAQHDLIHILRPYLTPS